MSDITVYFCLVFGIFISLVLPVVRKLATPPPAGAKGGIGGFVQRIWPTARPYVFMAIVSILVAVVLLAGLHVKKIPVDSASAAFLLGYFSDATMQKLIP